LTPNIWSFGEFLTTFKAYAALSILFLAFLSTSGCIHTDGLQNHSFDGVSDFVSSEDAAHVPASDLYDEPASPPELKMEFESSLNRNLFKTTGTLILQADSHFPYLMLNSTLWKDDRIVESTRYMIIDVKSGQSYSFNISEYCHLMQEDPVQEDSMQEGRHMTPGNDYTCVLTAQGPDGWAASEKRTCHVSEDKTSSDIRDELGKFDRDKTLYNLDPGLNSATSVRYFTPADQSQKAADKTLDNHVPTPYISQREYTSPDTPYPEASESDRASYGTLRDEPHSPDKVSTGKDNHEDESPQQSLPENNMGTTCVVGSASSDKYHRPDCRYAQKIKPENKIWFENVWEAREQGYVPCKVCKPT